jgi:hypothetical protein
MSDLWDIPLIPWHGDLMPAKVHEARSRALDAWENLEVSLFILDSWFRNIIKSNDAYGSGVIFVKRLEYLETTAEHFFVKYPNQANEGSFSILLCHIRNFALRRHDIAHGTVQPLVTLKNKDAAKIEFALLPALYTIQRRKHLRQFPNYAYTEQMLLGFELAFDQLRKRLNEFSEIIFPSLAT